MPGFLKKLDKVMDAIEQNCVGVATIIMVAVMFINVVLRNLFQNSLVWGNEVSSYLNIFAVYIAVSAGFKYGTHVGVSAFVDFVVPKKLRKPVAILTQLIILVFTVIIAWLAIRMSLAQYNSGQVSPVLKFPIWAVYGFVVLGMIGSVIRIIMEIVKIGANEVGPGAPTIEKGVPSAATEGGGKVC
jgi:TRAP-type C4-dicarboxylate transport system permease small subunit